MAIHTEISIYRTGILLLELAIKAQVQMPRTVKRALGEKITQRDVRAGYIDLLLARLRAVTVLFRVSHDSRYISPKVWADSIELLGSVGKQAGGWLKKTNRAPVV